MGGVGKSRLALELARLAGAGPDFPDGVWLVELAGVQDPEIVASTVASALRLTLRNGRSPATAVAEQLGSRTLLLIMDNCEHLLEACSALIQEVLARCPNINIVTTSREPLALPGELVYRVPSLDMPSGTEMRCPGAVPAGSRTAVRRTRLAYCAFVQTEQQRPRIRWRRSAIGLTAYHSRSSSPPRASPTSQCNELADGLGDALTLLRQRGRGRLDRQQTIAATTWLEPWSARSGRAD